MKTAFFTYTPGKDNLKSVLRSFRPHRLHAVHRCGLLLQMSHAAWSTCLSICVLLFYVFVCLCVLDELCKNVWADQDAVWGVDSRRSTEPRIRWGPDLPQEEALLGRHLQAHYNVPTHECIAHCSPSAVGECACTAPPGVTSRRCGLLPNYFGPLLVVRIKINIGI